MNPDDEGNAKDAEIDPVLRKSRLMYRKQRIRKLSELKLRLALLNDIETSNSFTEEKLSAEKKEIFEALSRLVLVNTIKNRQVLSHETKLHFELLKDLKRSNIYPQECDELIATMYLKLPPLSAGIGDTESVYSLAKRKKAARLAKREGKNKKATARMEQLHERARKKVARLAKHKERKEDAAGLAEQKSKRADQENENNSTEPAETGWEVVDEMDEVNASVAGFDMIS
jgi:hypothetical protein